MTIDEAMQVLENEARVAKVNDRPWEVKALRLGIEALKRYQLQRLFPENVIWETLPGETKE